MRYAPLARPVPYTCVPLLFSDSPENLMDFFESHRKQYPSMHIYHYAPYEPVALRRLARKHGTREDAVAALIRDRVLVDVYPIVKQGLIVGEAKTSLKKIELLLHAIKSQARAAAAAAAAASPSASTADAPQASHGTGRGSAKVTTATASVTVYGTWLQTRGAGRDVQGATPGQGARPVGGGEAASAASAGPALGELDPPIDASAGLASATHDFAASQELRDIRYYNAVDCANLMQVVEYVLRCRCC